MCRLGEQYRYSTANSNIAKPSETEKVADSIQTVVGLLPDLDFANAQQTFETSEFDSRNLVRQIRA